LDERINGTARVGLPWPSLLAFLRLVTNPAVFRKPATMSGAMRIVQAWLSEPTVWIPEPTPHHADLLDKLLGDAPQSRLVPDAHLAALAIEHGLTLCSNDGDFARFRGLRWENPLAG
jgi:uncharacterized protein